MAKILVHATHGPENPTRAALALLVAKAALEEGHTVSVFLAGDAAQLVSSEKRENDREGMKMYAVTNQARIDDIVLNNS